MGDGAGACAVTLRVERALAGEGWDRRVSPRSKHHPPNTHGLSHRHVPVRALVPPSPALAPAPP